MRPIVEIMTVNFSLLALDQILNNAATLLHMSGGQLPVPLVIRTTTGGGRQLAAQHSHSLEGWFAHIPGILVIAPGTVADAYTALAAALRDPNPVLIFEAAALLNLEGEVPDEPEPFEIGRARVLREGDDVALISYGSSIPKTLDAAAELARVGIESLVLDLRTLRPLDEAAILAAAARTHRVVIVDEGWRSGSLSAEIGMRIVEGAFTELDAPIARVCSAEVPVPYAKHLEDAALPSAARVVAAAKRVCGCG
jgi:pyruvate dehydrogenase E1 component beta subunit